MEYVSSYEGLDYSLYIASCPNTMQEFVTLREQVVKQTQYHPVMVRMEIVRS